MDMFQIISFEIGNLQNIGVTLLSIASTETSKFRGSTIAASI